MVRASLVAQMVKNLPEVQETWIWSLYWDGPLEKGMATHSSILAWRIPWTEEPGGVHSMGSQRVGHSWGTNTHTHTHTQYARTERYSHYASLTHPGHFPACWVLLLDIKWGQPGFGSIYFLFVLGYSGSDWTPRLGVVRGTVKKRQKLYKGTVLSPLNLISQFPERKKRN